MRRADRLFRLVELLRHRRFATASDLAEELGVSARTVYRDVQDLSRSGVPILGEAGVGYRLDPTHELPPLTFDADEIAALVLGSRMVETWGDDALAKSARSALRKIEAVLPDALARALAEIPLYVPPTARAADRRRAVGTLRSAMDERRKLLLEYEDIAGEPSERVVWPLGLWFFGDRWCLGAWCELRQDYRVFRPDRIVTVTLLEARFEETESINREHFLAGRVRGGS